MYNLIQKLQHKFPDILFVQSTDFHWSPANKTIYYNNNDTAYGSWSLLHEVGHGALDHTSYSSDVSLLHMEVAAWEIAQSIGASFEIIIDQDYIDDCLATYKDWLYKRSLCPQCDQHGVQITAGSYQCINCKANWVVGQNRFCRTYRKIVKKSPT